MRNFKVGSVSIEVLRPVRKGCLFKITLENGDTRVANWFFGEPVEGIEDCEVDLYGIKEKLIGMYWFR